MPGQLTVGDVLQTSLTVIQRNFLTFLVLVAVIVVPNIVVTIASAVATHFIMPGMMTTPGAVPDPQAMFQNLAMFIPIWLVTIVVVTITYAIAQAGMTFTAVEHMAGRSASAMSAMTAATRSLGALLVASFLVGILTAVGMMMCIVPGVIAALFFCLATPAILVERIGPIAGMERSIQLTEGHKGSIFLIFLVLFGAVLVFSLCVMGPLTAAVTFGTMSTPGAMPDPLNPAQILLNIVSAAVNGSLSAFGTTTVAVIYAKIRGIRDGVDAEAFARVFA